MAKKKTGDENIEDIDFETSLDEDGEYDAARALKAAKEKLKACERERQEYLEGWQRARADLINERKEADRRRASTADTVRITLVEELLPVLDNFDMAFANKALWERVDKNWRTGIEHIHASLLSLLERHNIEILDPLGQPFDPDQHESLGAVESNDTYPENTVAEVLQKGYRKDDLVIRPAKVKIAQKK